MARLDDFVADVVSSGLIPRSFLREVLQGFKPEGRGDEDVRLARELIRRELLTSYQARKLLSGATRGFFLGDYVILQRIGEGGMGKVYLARRRGDGQHVALKVLPPNRLQAIRNALDRFRREMDLSRLVRHKYVARTLDIGEEDGVHYMVMEYVPGDTLYNLVKDPGRGPFRVPDAARLFIKVCEGLAAAHDVGLVHRDIKPANIMVTPDGDAKILDLGLARTIEEEGGLTKPNTIIGTLDYASPEQLGDAAKADARSDLYSLGCTLYFALAGRPPFEGGDVVNKIFRHRMDEAEPLERVAQGVPAAFSAIVKKLMAKDPADRYQDARELANDLARWTDPATTRAILGAEGEQATAFRPPPPRLDEDDLRLLDQGTPSSLSHALRDLGEAAPRPAAMRRSPPVARPAIILAPDEWELQPPRSPQNTWLSRILIVIILLGAIALFLMAVYL
jgi:serine/threonine protein kinase